MAACSLLLAISTGLAAYGLTARVEATGHAPGRQLLGETSKRPTATPTPSATQPPGTGGPLAARESAPSPAPTPPAEQRPQFAWPADGVITSFFDAEHPLGIDVGVSVGAPIYASAAGTVVFAGEERCCGYGIKVDIDHGNGYLTRYGHLSEVKVRESDVVSQGQLIGLGGNTGFSTGPHLHFEIVHEDAVQDPMLFLPDR